MRRGDTATAYFPGLTTVEALLGVGITKREDMLLVRRITDEAMDMRIRIIGGMIRVAIDRGKHT
jgi:hypothetical protein